MMRATRRSPVEVEGLATSLRGKPLADAILAKVREDTDRLRARGRPVRLVSVLVGDAPAAEIYIRNQARAAARAGVDFVERLLPATTDEATALALIQALNRDPSVTGILIQRPLPGAISVKAMQGAISPVKDVEGMHPASIGEIVYGEDRTGPCTALAAVELLKSTGMRLQGLEAVVIGHSEIVGKPLAFLLMAHGATVTVCHHLTRSVAMHSRRADVVFVAVGKPQLVTGEMIKPGAIVIDIGINSVEAGGVTRVVGDVDAETVSPVAGWLTPVPGGVGPVTLAVLMRNALWAAETLAHRAAGEALDKIVIRDLKLEGRLGVYAHEKDQAQPLLINAEIEAARGGAGIGVLCYADIVERFRAHIAAGHVGLAETLADQLAELVLQDGRVRRVRLRLEKLAALDGVGGVGIEISRENHSALESR